MTSATRSVALSGRGLNESSESNKLDVIQDLKIKTSFSFSTKTFLAACHLKEGF